jgi:hypothetical protein
LKVDARPETPARSNVTAGTSIIRTQTAKALVVNSLYARSNLTPSDSRCGGRLLATTLPPKKKKALPLARWTCFENYEQMQTGRAVVKFYFHFIHNFPYQVNMQACHG